MTRLRVIYAGTPQFAVPALDALLADPDIEVVGVYTQPDRPAGRGQKLTPSPVKQLAVARGLPVFQPRTLRDADAQAELAALKPDLMVVAAYGLILPLIVLDTPRLGAINIHASILPRWRGAAPINRAIETGDAETGITIMQMAEGLDTGDMLAIEKTAIGPEDTAQTLHDRLSTMGAALLMKTLPRIVDGTIRPEPQDDAQATYAAKLNKAEAEIDWREPAELIARRVRAFNPWPVAFTHMQGNLLKIWGAEPETDVKPSSAAPGTVLVADAKGFVVATGEGVLRVRSCQRAGGRRVDAGDFARSQGLEGIQLG